MWAISDVRDSASSHSSSISTTITRAARLPFPRSTRATRDARATRCFSGMLPPMVRPIRARCMPACRRRAARSGCCRNGYACVLPDPKAESAHRMALDAAAGWGVPQDWNAALDLLRHSAELGFPLAQSTVALLAGDWALSQSAALGEAVNANWRALRDAI